MKAAIFTLVSIAAFVSFAISHASGNGIIAVDGYDDVVGFCVAEAIEIVANPGASQEHIDAVYQVALVECQKYQ